MAPRGTTAREGRIRRVAGLLAASVALGACATGADIATVGHGRTGGSTTTVIPESPPAGPPPITAQPPGAFLGPPNAVEPARLLTADQPASSDNGPSAEDTPGSDESEIPSTLVAHAAVPVVTARLEPSVDAEPVSDFAHPTDRGVPLVFQVLEGPVDGWLHVLLPIRPNGTTGWIRADDVDLTRNPYRIELDVGQHELLVFRGDETVVQTTVAIGTGATPTPIGDFYLTELLQPPDPDGAYGPFAYGLSGFSETLDSFNGGPGIIGIHGTNQPDLLGTNVSHGCVRVHNDVITEMATFIPLGTPVSIRNDADDVPTPLLD